MENCMLLEMGNEKQIGDLVASNKYWFEVKKDGCRALISNTPEDLKGVGSERRFCLLNRRGEDMASQWPELAALAESLPKNSKIDGEIYLPVYSKNKERPTTATRSSSNNGAFLSKLAPAVFCAFDVIRWNGLALTQEPIEKRKSILLAGLAGRPNCEVITFLEDPLAAWAKVVCDNEEGLVAKLKGSTYEFRRSRNWLKLKFWKVKDFKIIGYTTEKRGISALALEGGYKVNFGVDTATYLKYFNLFRKTGKAILLKDKSIGAEIEPGFSAEVRYLNLSENGIRFPILAEVKLCQE